MSSFVVIRAFQDKFTKVHFPVGSAYESDDAERVAFLQDEGFLGEKAHTEQNVEDRLKHLGGGIYELPDGERIKGKKQALEKLKENDESPPGE